MKTLFTTLALLPVFAFAQTIPTSGLLGDWPFDNNALDYSGNANHGTPSGVTPAHDRFGNPNKAYKFDGINDIITVPNNSNINLPNGTSFSFAYWQKAYTGNGDCNALTKHIPGSWNGFSFFSNLSNPGYCGSVNHLQFYTASGAMQDACSNSPVVADSTWRFIVGVHNATTNQSFLYVDGVLQTDVGQASGLINNTADLIFGSYAGTNATFFRGVLDGARYYGRVLTDNEILQLFNECVAPAPAISTTAPGKLKICTNKSTQLSASGQGTLYWYNSPTSTVALGTGATYSTATLPSGIYTFYVAASNSCTQSARSAITVTVSECLGTPESVNLLNELVLRPNPGSGWFYLDLPEGTYEAQVINQLGQLVLQQKINGTGSSFELSALPAGIYYLKVTERHNSRTVKLVKE